MTTQKTIIITGASSDIGLALAQAFLQRGDRVIGNARTLARLHAAKQQFTRAEHFIPVAGDIALPDTAQALFDAAKEHFGGVDILINNAGIFSAKPITQYTDADLQGLLNTNLKGFFYTSQQAAKMMSVQGHGKIINITASIAMQPNANVPASLPILLKGGINAATRALAIELAPHNIQVNAIAPGIVDTPLYSPDMHDFLKSMQPAGRIGRVEEIVAAAVYLADANFTTGTVLPVDGGMSAGKW